MGPRHTCLWGEQRLGHFSGVALAERLFLEGQYADPDGAEQISQWVLEQKKEKLGLADPEVYDARYKLGKAIHAQGRGRYDGLAPI